MGKIQAIIFDADGTLADTIGAITTAMNRMLQQNGFPTHTQEDIRNYIGNGAVMLARRALPVELYDNDTEVHRYYDLYNREYARCFLETREMYPGMPSVISELSNHFKIGVLSNKDDFILKPLVHQWLAPCCAEYWVQGPTPDTPTKPSRQLTQKLLSAMGVTPGTCIMVGDSDVDKRTADEAGMEHIGVTWGFRSESFLKEHGVTRLAHSPDELLHMILQNK